MSTCFCTGECKKTGVCPNAYKELSLAEFIKKILEKKAPKYVTEAYEDWQIVHKLEGGECLWDKFSEEDRRKPMMLSCPCKKCTPYCM